MDLTRLPIAGELFAQWRRARGDRMEAATRPFSRGWEALLEDASILSASDRGEAERDARALANDGWLELKPVRYRPHLIDRVAVPLAAELRWREAFGFTPPTDDEMRQVREFAWEPELAFLRTARVSLPFDELRRMNEFLATGGRGRLSVPIKERSLEILGDEKRLDALYGSSSLFDQGRLTPQQLRCFVVAEPLGWKRGKAPTGPVIVLENAATWDSYSRWDAERKVFSAVVYGGGNRFALGVSFLAEVFLELGGRRQVLYFGDIDPAGLRIPQTASRQAQLVGLPTVEPHFWSYRQLLELGRGKEVPDTEGASDAASLTWLGPLAEPVEALFAQGKRLAQEHVGWEFLQGRTAE